MNSTTFTIPNDLLTRLSRLHHVTDASNPPSNLRHIHLRVTPEHVRFAATNGRMLAVLKADLDDLQGDAREAILDVHQFNDAIKAVQRGIPQRSNQRVNITLTANEAKFSTGNAAALVRQVPGTYPNVDHVFTRTEGQRWVPCLSSLNPDLASVAQKLVGKTTVLFSSPVAADATVSRLWTPGAPDDHKVPVSIAAMRSLVTAPAYWCDHELALLVMPVSRAASERQLDLMAFVRQVPAASAAAA